VKTNRLFASIVLAIITSLMACGHKNSAALVFQTDFGLKDGAVSAMKGVAHGIDASLQMYDVTHEIPPYNIWEAAYRLNQAAPFWPKGTVFVSVVDPGVGTSRKSIVMKSKSGQFFVTPDNGTLTLVAESLGIDEVREIDETVNRRKNSAGSYTFHGRDVYAYTGARLASGVISFEEVGKKLSPEVIMLQYQHAASENGSVKGNIPVLDIQYGNIWTNIPDSLVKGIQSNNGDSISVEIFDGKVLMYKSTLPFVHTFGEVAVGKQLAYLNSLMNLSLAINEGNFADSFHIGSGPEWSIVAKKK
jgi:S-adenosylmethionine hydrolase